MDVRSPQPWTSIVVGTATDDQDPPNNCQDRLVETKSGTHRSGLQKSACGFQNRACELESSARKLQAGLREALVRSREALVASGLGLVGTDIREPQVGTDLFTAMQPLRFPRYFLAIKVFSHLWNGRIRCHGGIIWGGVIF